MKVVVTPTEAAIMHAYGISNFQQLLDVYKATNDTRLERVIAASYACINAMY